jgi:hypothetical protein
MELYIQIRDGVPFEHPIQGDNFRQAFPEIDVNNLPSSFAKFERVEKPEIGLYQVYEGATYEFVDGVCRDVHQVRNLTEEEKVVLQNDLKTNWDADTGFYSWTLDIETGGFIPPTPRPEDEKTYMWDEATLSWIEVSNA